MDDAETVIGARKAMGDQLRALREAAGHSQSALARRIGYARPTLADAERGQGAGRLLWERCDEVLRTNGALVKAYVALEVLSHQRRLESELADEARRVERAHEWRQGHDLAQAPVTAADSRGEVARTVADALRQTLGDSSPEVGEPMEDLEDRVMDAFQKHDRGPEKLSLTLVGGFAGSGKSEFARALTGMTGWGILDKDTVTRALVEQLLISYGAEPNDRQTELYQTKVRPYEYRAVLDQAIETLESGASQIVTAPFIREFADETWLRRIQNRCTSLNAVLSIVWVKCDMESMHDYIRYRGASRDAWKLANWDDYLATIDPEFEPRFPHYVVDNRLNAAVALAEQARHVALQVRHGV
jgi:predicted kinase/DNA-binding XRE family transcriptional regulator